MIIYAAFAGAIIVAGFVLFVAELTRRAPAPGTPPRRLPRASLSPDKARLYAIAVCVGIGVGGLTGWPVAGISTVFAIIHLPKITGNRANKRHTAMLEGLEQWVRRLADMLTASRGLQDALEASAKTAPEAVAGPVTALARRLSARIGTEEALRAFADEIGDPAGDRIAAALIIATGQRGGGVRGVLGALAEMLARDVAARREIEADRAQHRTTVRWIIIFVGGFTLFAFLNKSYSAPYGTLTGELMLGLVAILYGVGLTWLHKLGIIPTPGRFLDQQAAGLGDMPPRLMGTQADIGQFGMGYTGAGYADASYGDASYGDASYGDASYGDASYGDASYGDASYGDAGYPIGGGP